MMAEHEPKTDVNLDNFPVDDVMFQVGGVQDGNVYRTAGNVGQQHSYEVEDNVLFDSAAYKKQEPPPHRTKRETHIHGPTTYHMYHSSDEEETTSDDGEGQQDEFNSDLTNKPLMPPRQRNGIRVKTQNPKQTLPAKFFWRLIYLIIFVAALAAFVCLIMYIVDVYTTRLMLADQSDMYNDSGHLTNGDIDGDNLTLIGCDRLTAEDVWIVGLPKILTESAHRLVDVNQDGVLDVIIGFASGVDRIGIEKDGMVECEVYFNGTFPCGGGMIAFNGVSGDTLWQHYSQHEMFSINCQVDLNQDGVKDCIGGGRGGTFGAVSGRDGASMWVFNDSIMDWHMNTYTGQYVGDMDGDGIPDIINIHGGDPFGEPGSKTRLIGKVIFFSGRTGEVLGMTNVTEPRESYYSPVLYRRRDGTDYVLIGTGGETHSGGLWLITLKDLQRDNIHKAKLLFEGKFKGIMTPPVFADINKDGTEDIIFTTFNSSVVALDGETYETLWIFIYPEIAETYATPAPGYYNDDDIPDFLIRFQQGPGFPVYYYSFMTILDGATGLPLITPFANDTIGAQSSPLTVSSEGIGNDIFLYWMAGCHGQNRNAVKFRFINGTNVHEKSRSDLCKLRFKAAGYTELRAISSKIKLPGATIYNSDERYHIERSKWVNTSLEGQAYLYSHPEKLAEFKKEQEKLKEYWRNMKEKDEKKKDEKSELASLLSEIINNNEVQDKAGRLSSENKQLGVADHMDSGGNTIDLDNNRSEQTEFRQPDNNNDKQSNWETESTSNVNGDGNGREAAGGDGQNSYNYVASSIDNNEYPWKNYVEDSEAPSRDNWRRFMAQYDGDKDSKRHDWETSQNKDDENMSPQRMKGDRLPSQDRPRGEMTGEHEWQNEESRGERRNNNGRDARQRSWLTEINGKSSLPNQKKTGRGVDKAESVVKAQDLKRRYMDSFGRKKKRARKEKRHIGPHDGGGLQRLISTGTVAPPLLEPTHPDYGRSMDIVFSTYWFYPAKTQILLPEDEACIKKKMDTEKIRFDPKSHYHGMDHDAYQHVVQDECLNESGHLLPDKGIYMSQLGYNPYNLHLGQLTVYRIRMKCECSVDDAVLRSRGQRCARLLPFSKQQWTGYMGSNGDSHWLPRPDHLASMKKHR